jgi:hypothetical protein
MAINVAYHDQKDINKELPGVYSCLGLVSDYSHYLPKITRKIQDPGCVKCRVQCSAFGCESRRSAHHFISWEKDSLGHFTMKRIRSVLYRPSECPCSGFTMPTGIQRTFGLIAWILVSKTGDLPWILSRSDGGHVLSGNDFGLEPLTLKL